MKLHDLRPAEGARKPRTRVGRGIAAGKGKTAGRGTKGQKSRTGGTIQPWFEGGQTPIHVRIPKLRGFKNKFRIEYEVVNVGRHLGPGRDGHPRCCPRSRGRRGQRGQGRQARSGQAITPEILAAAGLVRSLDKPLKVLGQGDVSRPLFIVADAFSKSATAKIEAAGGTAQVLEFPGSDGSPTRSRRSRRDEGPAEADGHDGRSRQSRCSAKAGGPRGRGSKGRSTKARQPKAELLRPLLQRRRPPKPRLRRPRRASTNPPRPPRTTAAGSETEKGASANARVDAERVPRAGHPQADAVRVADPDDLPCPGARADPGHQPQRSGRARAAATASSACCRSSRAATCGHVDRRTRAQPVHQRHDHHADPADDDPVACRR